jgi:predicted phage terminase large subunit-like protein
VSDTIAADERQLLDLEQLQWQRQCRSAFLPFCVEALSPGGETPAQHHRLIVGELQSVAQGRTKRLMILAPPGSAKTTYASRLFPAWLFAFRPRSSIIAVSHTQELAETNSAFVQRIIREHSETLGYRLSNDARGRWYTDNHCGYLAAGVGSAILGFRANIVLIDDPIRSRADAESETLRESTWDWFTNDLTTRLTPDGAIVLIATPFHEDDLMGRILRLQQGEWRVLRLPAIADSDNDPLGRQIGEPLWSDDQYGYGARLLEIQAACEREGRSRDWAALYQGRPRPPDGALFNPAKMPVLDVSPPVIQEVRAWDLASTVKGDWTCGVKLARCRPEHRSDLYVVTDVVRFRGPPEVVRATVRRVADADGHKTQIRIPLDPGQAGVDQSVSYASLLTGFRVRFERMSGDKATRADPVASQCNIGRVAMLRAPWNPTFTDELASFPLGQHDDQVDALRLAANSLFARPPMRISDAALALFSRPAPHDPRSPWRF